MKDFYFLPSHEWFNKADKTVGISDYAQKELGDIVFVELPEVGDKVTKGKPFANVESVKAVSEIFCPVSGEVEQINEEILDNPALINDDAFAAWMIKLSGVSDEEGLLGADEYNASIK